MTKGRSEDTVTVWYDGRPLVVPRVVEGHYAVRGWLGVPRGLDVARELGDTGKADGEPLSFETGHEFVNGESYVSVGADAFIMDDDTPAAPWQADPEAWKRGAPDEVPQPPFPGEPLGARAIGDGDENVDMEEWGLCVSVPQLELQVHQDLGVVVAVMGPWLREMVEAISEDQDRLAWSLLPDSDGQRRATHEAIMRSLKITPKSMVRGEQPDEDGGTDEAG